MSTPSAVCVPGADALGEASLVRVLDWRAGSWDVAWAGLCKLAARLGVAEPVRVRVPASDDVLGRVWRDPMLAGAGEACGWLVSVYGSASEALAHGVKACDIAPRVAWSVRLPSLCLPGGWTLAGVVEPVPGMDRNLILSAPGVSLGAGVSAVYGSGALRCDHCGSVRARVRTLLVRDAAGAVRAVGSSCVRDYLGHGVGSLVGGFSDWCGACAELAGFSEDDEWAAGGVSRGASLVSVADVACAALCALRLSGWAFVSATKAREAAEFGDHSLTATADRARGILWPSRLAGAPDPIVPDASDCALADSVLAGLSELSARALADDATLSDYERNAGLCLAAGVVRPARVSLVVACVCLSHLRTCESAARAVAAARGPSVALGAVGERVALSFTVERVRVTSGEYGDRMLVAGWATRADGVAGAVEWWTTPTAAESAGLVVKGAAVSGAVSVVGTVKGVVDADRWGPLRTALARVSAPPVAKVRAPRKGKAVPA